MITDPAGSLSVPGNSITISGSCLSNEGNQTNQLIAGVGDIFPVMPGVGNCNCFNNTFSCSVVAPKGTYDVIVADTFATENIDSIEIDFTGITSPDWLNYTPFIYTNVASSSAPIQDPVIYKSNSGFVQSNVPLYFLFSEDSISASSTLRFSIYDTDGDFIRTEYQEMLSDMSLSNENNLYTFNFSLSASTTRHFIATLQTADEDIKTDYITAEWVDSSSTNPINIYDFGNYFPKIKATLMKKILFRQVFQFYDGMTTGLAQIDVSQALKVNAHMISADHQYNLVFPILDFTTPQILAFAQPIRKVVQGFLVILFGVWLLLRITRTLNI